MRFMVKSQPDMTHEDDVPDLHHQYGMLELMISCTDLINLDVFSKTDPMCVLFVRKFGQWKEFGRTEAVQEMLSPQFTESFILNYDSELTQAVMLSVYDIDSRSTDLRRHDYVGSVELLLSDLVKDDQVIVTTTRSLRVPGNPHSRGLIHITSEFVKESKGKVCLHLGAHKLAKKGVLSVSKSDTFVEVCKQVSSIHYHAVYRSEVIYKSQNPRWKPFEISLQKLCNGDLDRNIQISCWRIHSDHSYHIIGKSETTIKALHDNSNKSYQSLPLLHPKKIKKKKYKQSGELRVLECRLDLQHTLFDYVKGGITWRVILGIDFTFSNGIPSDPASLHYLDGACDNQYVEAIKNIVGMLSQYDEEQKIPTFGFGAKLSRKKKKHITNNCFPITKNEENQHGIDGVLEAYRAILPKLTLSGPSVFTYIIEKSIQIVEQFQDTSVDDQAYFVLVILTDGVVNDLDLMTKSIIEASKLPLSVVIVGVGPADFSIWEQMDNPGLPLKSHDKKLVAKRDNFHFAPLRRQKYKTGTYTAIARETLASVSKHFLDYMKSKKIVPNHPVLNRLKYLSTPNLLSSNKIINSNIRSISEQNLSVNGKPTMDIFPNPQQRSPSQDKFHGAPGPICPTCGSLIGDQSSLTDLESGSTGALFL